MYYPNFSKILKNDFFIRTFFRSIQVVVVAAEDISKGTEISDSYGLVHYLTNETSERQNILKRRYNFDCNCVACEQVYIITIS
jgi:hypothetical protein